MRSVRHGQDAVGIAIVNRAEIDPFEIDLIRACSRAVARETENLCAECGRLIELQRAGRCGEGYSGGVAAPISSVACAPIVAAPTSRTKAG